VRVTDRITAQQLSVDEAYERFFDGFYNLGRPAEIFERTVVLSPPQHESARAHRHARAHSSGRSGGAIKRLTRRK
jgi:hypothetical protein